MSKNAIISSLPPAVAFSLGQIHVAHLNRKFHREFADTASRECESAKRDVSSFGMYDDCGPSYQKEYQQSKSKFELAVSLKIASEKFYKKLKHEFLEAHQEHKEALESLIPGSTKLY